MNCLTQESVGFKKSLNEYMHSDLPQLHEEIAEKYSDLLGPLPLKLPPFHEVSHEIPLINKSKQLKHTVGNKTVQMFGRFGLCIEYIF